MTAEILGYVWLAIVFGVAAIVAFDIWREGF